jgi:cytochrome c oxidase subunit 2
MTPWIPLWRPGVTDHAASVDTLFVGLLATSLFVLLLLFFLIFRFAIQYRAGNTRADRRGRVRKSWIIETAWTVVTLAAFLGLFVWGARLYLDLYGDAADAIPIYVVGKQWMWKVQHVGGQREINELHIPVGRDIRLIMTSQDVIHSFFIPSFRIKEDVVPGSYAGIRFRVSKPGIYHLFCAEYCGTDHSRMTGRIVVMTAPDFEQWLAGQTVTGSLAEEGGRLFRALGCGGCHGNGAVVRAPSLDGIYGKPVPLSDGRVVIADERYLRDSILRPRSDVAAGYQPVMPSFAGRISEDDLIRIVAYIKSLKPAPEGAE